MAVMLDRSGSLSISPEQYGAIISYIQSTRLEHSGAVAAAVLWDKPVSQDQSPDLSEALWGSMEWQLVTPHSGYYSKKVPCAYH